jgi:hypothetical protein
MSTVRTVALFTLGLVLALPVAAQAKLPSPKSKTIVFGKSIAGVKLGMSLDAAKKVWGTGSICADSVGATVTTTKCSWADKKNGSATFTTTNGKVTVISLSPAVKNVLKQQFKLSGPITAFKTSKGIAIGSTLKALQKAYPKAKDGAADTLAIRSGSVVTSFGNENGKISVISISTGLVS